MSGKRRKKTDSGTFVSARALRGRDKRRGRDGARVFHRVAFLFSSASFVSRRDRPRLGNPARSAENFRVGHSVRRSSAVFLLFFAHLAVRHTPLIIDRRERERQGQRKHSEGRGGQTERRKDGSFVSGDLASVRSPTLI